MNILSFDIEEWYLEKALHADRVERYAIFDRFLNEILNLLDERCMKATFFCVGGMGDDFPHIVRLIDERGHEIGCHSYRHTWLNKMTHAETLEDTRRAVEALEQCVGKKILSYRAPAFSIGKENRYAMEVLAECGIERDSSIFPAARDFGGFPDFGHKTPVTIEYNGIRLKEFPICTAKLLGKELAYSGGGYFRFFPLWFVKREINRNDYAMCYFHIDDLIAETSKVMSREEYEDYFKERGTLLARYKRYFKSNFGKKRAWNKMESLIKTTPFVSLNQADPKINWHTAPSINL